MEINDSIPLVTITKMYFVYGCPKVLRLQPEAPPRTSGSASSREEILAVAFNPSGSLLAVASTSRICVWSGGNNHVPLGSFALPLRGLSSGGTSLLWRRDSGVVGVVSDAGKLVLVSVKKKSGIAMPVVERFPLPDWFEPQVRCTDSCNISTVWSYFKKIEFCVMYLCAISHYDVVARKRKHDNRQGYHLSTRLTAQSSDSASCVLMTASGCGQRVYGRVLLQSAFSRLRSR